MLGKQMYSYPYLGFMIWAQLRNHSRPLVNCLTMKPQLIRVADESFAS